MADQDNNQEQPKSSLFHDIGEHMANAYQQFLNQHSQTPATPEESLAQAQNRAIDPQQQTPLSPIVGQGATPVPADQMAQMGMQPQSQSTPQMAPQTTPMVPQTAQPMTQPDVGAGSGGLPGPLTAQSNLANAAQDVGQNIQDISSEGQDSQKQLVSDTQQHFQNNMKQDQQLMEAYMSKKIDPNQVINSMSTGKKVMTTLGLLFSGIGSGLTGQKNLALEMVNNAIARDLDAQKSAQGQAYNAYQMHREGTKDEFTADLQHQKDNLMAIDAAIEQQKAKLMGPQAIAAATQTQLGIRNQVLDLNQKSAMWQATKQSLSNQNDDPASKIRKMQLTGQINPGQAEKAFQELDKVSNHQKQESTILDSFDQANKENTIVGRASHLGATPASVAALQNQLMPYLKDAEGRINETEIKRTDQLIPSPGDSPHKIATKRQALVDFMKEKSGSSLLKGLGINAGQSESNQEVKTMNGKKYQKVPGGWMPL